MVTEEQRNIFKLEIPLPGSPLKMIHPYLVKGAHRNLLIDAAFNMDECEQALLEQLKELGVELENTDVFVTHLHVDHSGLISRLKCPGNKIYASAVDRALIDRFQQQQWDWITQNVIWSGAPPEHSLHKEEHVAFMRRPSCLVPIETVEFGQILSYGDYNLEVVDLAGHTPGQIGLWHEPSKTLFSGDHILCRITPNITTWDLEQDYLKIFCDNLRKAKDRNVKHLYTAHRENPKDINGRIDELLEHHRVRLEQIYSFVANAEQPMTAYSVALLMEWAAGKKLPGLPIQQKWFAMTETLAHLQHLAFEGKLLVHEKNSVYFYEKA